MRTDPLHHPSLVAFACKNGEAVGSFSLTLHIAYRISDECAAQGQEITLSTLSNLPAAESVIPVMHDS